MARIPRHSPDPQIIRPPSQRATRHGLLQPRHPHLRQQVRHGLPQDRRRAGARAPLPLAPSRLAPTGESGRAGDAMHHGNDTRLPASGSPGSAQPTVGGILRADAGGEVRHEFVAVGGREGRGARMGGCGAEVEGAGGSFEG